MSWLNPLCFDAAAGLFRFWREWFAIFKETCSKRRSTLLDESFPCLQLVGSRQFGLTTGDIDFCLWVDDYVRLGLCKTTHAVSCSCSTPPRYCEGSKLPTFEVDGVEVSVMCLADRVGFDFIRASYTKANMMINNELLLLGVSSPTSLQRALYFTQMRETFGKLDYYRKLHIPVGTTRDLLVLDNEHED